MTKVEVSREAKTVTVTETRKRVFNLEVEDKKGNWLGTDANGKFYSNNPVGIKDSLWKDVEEGDRLDVLLAARYLSIIRKKGIVKV